MTATLAPTSSWLACAPRWGTPRTDGRDTYGGRVAAVAEALGTPLMPWQRYVADVALEVDPETGVLAYREVVVTIPRQSGKTTLGLSVRVHRAFGFGEPQTLIFTAQTRNDARQKWEDEHEPILKGSPFTRLVHARKRPGAEAFVWRDPTHRRGCACGGPCGSIDHVAAPTAKAGHGKTLDLGFADEAFAQTDDRLEQAFRPAMITRAQPQIWIVSTAGTSDSVWLKSKVDAGRRLVESGERSATAYFEWSAPDGADPRDRSVWWSCMPALGHTVTEAAIAAELDSMLREHGEEGLGVFRRAYLNQWVDGSGESVIPKSRWEALADPDSHPDGPVVMAIDVSTERSSAAIGVAGRNAAGIPTVELADYRPGVDWVVARASLTPDLEEAGIDVELVSSIDLNAACGAFYDAVIAPDGNQLRHPDDPALTASALGARKKQTEDSWRWARKDAAADECPLVAVTMARHGLAGAGDPLNNIW
jgi:hypothetical protein